MTASALFSPLASRWRLRGRSVLPIWMWLLPHDAELARRTLAMAKGGFAGSINREKVPTAIGNELVIYAYPNNWLVAEDSMGWTERLWQLQPAFESCLPKMINIRLRETFQTIEVVLRHSAAYFAS